MTQRTSPFLEGKYGWDLGESNWNLGMDENLTKFSYMFDRNINGIVSSLPAPVSGEAYFLTTDKKIYFCTSGLFTATPVPKWFIVTIKSSGDMYQFDGTSLVQIDNPSQIDSRIDSVISDASAFQANLANQTDDTKGAELIGYKNGTVQDKLLQRIDVTDYWLAIDPDWSNAFDRARDVATNAYSTVNYPYNVPEIWCPRPNTVNGAYGISRPIHCQVPLRWDGDNVRIYALPGFVGKTIPLFGGGTEVNKSMFIFLNGQKNDLAGLTRWGAKLGIGLILDCQEIADTSAYIERMPYSEIRAQSQGSPHDGYRIGAYNWGLAMDGVVIENFTDHGIHYYANAAVNGASLLNARIWGEFKEGQSGLCFDAQAECNGFSATGSFIEKVLYGVIISTGNGPMNFSGMDFEQCRNGVFRAVGNTADAKIGPIIVQSTYLHSLDAVKVYADWATIIVDGCRTFGPQNDFGTDGLGRGVIVVGTNTYLTGGVAKYDPSCAAIETVDSPTGRSIINHLHHKTNAFVPGYEIKNYQYRDAPTLQSSGLSFFSNYLGGGTGEYFGASEWFVSEYQHISNPGVLAQRVAVQLLGTVGQNSFGPSADVITSNGTLSMRWADTYSQRVRLGAGTAFDTSGTGTPEGVVTAPVGSTYRRTNGAAVTTFYVKETGTGNTGWVAK